MVNDTSPNEIPVVHPTGTALVPFTPRIERRSRRRWYRWAPDTVFVAHLIAEAQQVPQARRIRRGSLADAQSAYRTGQATTHSAGHVMRQVI